MKALKKILLGISTSTPDATLDISSGLEGSIGAYTNAPKIRLTQTEQKSYNDGDVTGEIEFYTKDTGGAWPGPTAFIKAVHRRDGGGGHGNPDMGLDFGVSNSGGLAETRMTLEVGGNLGVGTTNPGEKLDVAGNIKVSGTVDGRDVAADGTTLDNLGNDVDDLEAKKYLTVVQSSGRWTLFTDNRWVGFNNSYGQQYHIHSQTAGTAAVPSTVWNKQGYFVPKGAVIKAISIKGRTNAADASSLDIFLRAYTADFTQDDPINSVGEVVPVDVLGTTDLQFGANGSGTSNFMHVRRYDLDYTMPEHGDLHFYLRPVGTLAATRYFYGVVSIEIAMPSV